MKAAIVWIGEVFAACEQGALYGRPGLARADVVKRPHHGPRFPLSAKKEREFETGQSGEPGLFDHEPAADLTRVLPKGRNFH